MLERALGRVDRLPRWTGPAAATAVAAAGGALLTANNPTAKPLLPPCPLYALTGLYCPGCGGTRAAHALLNGDVMAAFEFNPLLVIGLPLVVFAFVRWWAVTTASDVRPVANLGLRPRVYGVLFALVLVFGASRNLPWSAFSWMAP